MGRWGNDVSATPELQAVHLDSNKLMHHDACMRTTVTLDEDVARLLRDTMHRSRTSFKEALNAAIRAGLSRGRTPIKKVPFVIEARRLGLRPGLDPAGLNKLADDLEVDEFLQKAGRSERK